MGQLSPEITIGLAVGALLALALLATLIRRVARPKNTRAPEPAVQPSQPAANRMPPLQQTTPSPQPANPTVSQPVTQPVRLATSQPAPQPSYTAIAVAEAARAAPKPPTTDRTGLKAIDYSNELTSVVDDASYAAIAVTAAARAARGLPPLESAPPSRAPSNDNPAKSPGNGSAQSYAAIAAANSNGLAARETAPPSPARIDYSGIPPESLASASYTAIAVAAARHD